MKCDSTIYYTDGAMVCIKPHGHAGLHDYRKFGNWAEHSYCTACGRHLIGLEKRGQRCNGCLDAAVRSLSCPT